MQRKHSLKQYLMISNLLRFFQKEYLLFFDNFHTCKQCILIITTPASPPITQHVSFSPYVLYLILFCKPMSPISIACWNADQICWLDLMQVTTGALSSRVNGLYLVQTMLFPRSPHLLVLIFFPPPLFTKVFREGCYGYPI